ncbi:MAG: sigma-54-dependent Fis family transcriptional regulator [Deltaproteobacteria bacterium]|nr:sigma-54-dependent Fis family transcriptional regulator [Deltaproteobacteria bacterium]
MSGTRPAGRVLIVDDEPQVARAARLTLGARGFEDVATCTEPRAVERLLGEQPTAVLLLDLNMPELPGMELLRRVRVSFPDVAVIVMTANDDVTVAVDAMRRGAVDYLVKPVAADVLEARVHQALVEQADRHEASTLRAALAGAPRPGEDVFAGMITQAPAMKRVFAYVDAIARGAQPVLILGESGTGKELVARALHAAGQRPGPFVALNVAGLEGTLLDDALFGHAPGAFAGAGEGRRGAIAAAGSGTLFLDEIGDLDAGQQVKLLRVLETRRYTPLGSDELEVVRARVVAATNRPPGDLREDLLFRLRSYQITMPPLRERVDDVLLLARHFLAAAAEELGRRAPALGPEAQSVLLRYRFPGNVRELRSLMLHAAAVAEERVEPDHLVPMLIGSLETRPADGDILDETALRALERDNMVRALRRCGWQIAGDGGAAELLGLKPSTLASRMKTLEVSRERDDAP